MLILFLEVALIRTASETNCLLIQILKNFHTPQSFYNFFIILFLYKIIKKPKPVIGQTIFPHQYSRHIFFLQLLRCFNSLSYPL